MVFAEKEFVESAGHLYITLILCVWLFIDSAPGGHTDLRPVLLEPVWPGGVQPGKNSIQKWSVAEL